jgi:hypothetical protein
LRRLNHAGHGIAFSSLPGIAGGLRYLIKNDKTASVNASFYDIREYFQGRNESGTMNTKSDDETYNALIKNLREKHKKLAKKIEPKIYKYGFLKR